MVEALLTGAVLGCANDSAGVEVRGGFRIKKRKLGPKHVDAAVSLAMAAQRAIETSGSTDMPFVEVF